MNVYQLLKQSRGRLQKLNIKAAKFGISTPPEIELEQEDLNEFVTALKNLITNYEAGLQTESLEKKAIRLGATVSITINSFEFD